MYPKKTLEQRRGPRNHPGSAPLAVGLAIGLTALTIMSKHTKEQTAAVLNSSALDPSATIAANNAQRKQPGTVQQNKTKQIIGIKIQMPDPEQPQCTESKGMQSQNDDSTITDYPILSCNEGQQPLVKIYRIHDDLSEISEYPDCAIYSNPTSIFPIEISAEFDVDLIYEQDQPFLVYFPEKETQDTINKSTVCR